MEDPGAKGRRVQKYRYDVFLSYSSDEKAFVEQFHEDLSRAKYNTFFDQGADCLPKSEQIATPINNGIEQCRVVVVVVSEGYLTSLWPMLELSKCVECGVTVLPLFFRLSPNDLKASGVLKKCKDRWRSLVKDGRVGKEVVDKWSEAVEKLGSTSGWDFKGFAGSEVRYRRAVLEDMCKRWPPILDWSTDGIQGFDRLCEKVSPMFVKATVGGADRRVLDCLAIYGMRGSGKSVLCQALCAYFVHDFGGRVWHLELPHVEGADQKAGEDRLKRLKVVLEQFGSVDKLVLNSISTEQQGWKCLKDGLENMPPLFLAIDNVGDFAASREEARMYLKVGLPSGSKVLVTSNSQETLKAVIGEASCCKLPGLEWADAANLLLSCAAPNIPSESWLKSYERTIVEKCLSQCEFRGNGPRHYHPLMLKVLGTYLDEECSGDVMSWGLALKNWKSMQRWRQTGTIHNVLGSTYHSLSDVEKLVFLDSVLYCSVYISARCDRWLCDGNVNELEAWVSWISEFHDLSLVEAKAMVKKFQGLSLLEESDSEVSVQDPYKDFTVTLVDRGESDESKCWRSRSSDQEMPQRLVLVDGRSIFGGPPPSFLKWQNLVLLELVDCERIGPCLEVGSFVSLRALCVAGCRKLKRITCSCSERFGGVCCYESDRNWGCMSELRIVELWDLNLLEGDEGVPFMRHCSNLQRVERVPTR